MHKTGKTFYFSGSKELDRLLKEFQLRNKIDSKSKAIKLLLNTGLRNWSPPAESPDYDKYTRGDEEPSKKKKNHHVYEVITGSKH